MPPANPLRPGYEKPDPDVGVSFLPPSVSAASGCFTYEVGTNGGGAFVAFYLLGPMFIEFPLMLADFASGRRGAADATNSIAAVAAG
jgi:hypothetical protein